MRALQIEWVQKTPWKDAYKIVPWKNLFEVYKTNTIDKTNQKIKVSRVLYTSKYGRDSLLMDDYRNHSRWKPFSSEPSTFNIIFWYYCAWFGGAGQ